LASFLKQVRLSEGSETSSSSRASRRKGTSLLPEGRELVPSASFGKLHLWRFPKEAPEVPEGSNFFLNVLREASPLAAFRRKRTCFIKFHLWRGGGFLRKASPLAGWRLSEGSELVSVLRKASPLGGWRFLRKEREGRHQRTHSLSERSSELRVSSTHSIPEDTRVFPKEEEERHSCCALRPPLSEGSEGRPSRRNRTSSKGRGLPKGPSFNSGASFGKRVAASPQALPSEREHPVTIICDHGQYTIWQSTIAIHADV